MMGRARHLHDDRLVECYASVRTNEPLDPRLVEHLADCEACAARYGELARFMDGLSAEATAESDAVFTAERLQAQRAEVARRIEHVGRPARVISFPRPAVGDHAPAARPVHARSRWIATAAAAGLVMGLALGVTFEWERQGRVTGTVAGSRQTADAERLAPAVQVPVEVSVPQPGPVSDDSFLSELDGALDRPRFGSELQMFDALTPHVREIRNLR
jgi:hypothetical protein